MLGCHYETLINVYLHVLLFLDYRWVPAHKNRRTEVTGAEQKHIPTVKF